ncbi:alpha/beta fold hydrolase [uncultured Roseobacter sp.]|uniref:alpha/beta fold hydrolase n=1 Tax=uncultured Roseobacter sp. TaxID=114847 RepID=UPI002601AA70|nr:alpha/beta fold hydrolase [uncultured Roseobacter sp.]
MIPLVLVHGFMGGSAQWDLQQDRLARDRPLIVVDLPGFGENNSAPPIDSIPGFADWVVAHLDSLGVTRFHLMGHSMGGMIVQQMARQAPDRIDRLVLYSTGVVGILPGRFETIAQSKERAAQDGVKPTARRIAATWFLDSKTAPKYEACARIAEQTAPAAFDAGLDAMQNWSGAEALGAIRSETLVLWGDGDRTYPWSQTEKLWQGVPDAQLAVVPGCAHAVHLEKPMLFNTLVSDFLAER